MINYIKHTTSEFFYAIFACTVIYAVMLLSILSIALPFIAVFLVAQSNPDMHILAFCSIFLLVFYVEFLILNLFDWKEHLVYDKL